MSSERVVSSRRDLGRAQQSWGAFFLNVTGWLMPLLAVATWLVMRHGDRSPVPTLLAYGPRWIWLVPSIVMLPAVYWKPRLLLPLSSAIALGLLTTMQLQVNLPASGSASPGTGVTIVSYNGGNRATDGALLRLADETKADILALQESVDEPMPGWNVRCAGRLCTASRYPITSFESVDRRLIGGHFAIATAAVLQAPFTPITLVNVHLETVREGIEAVQHSGVNGARDLRANLIFRELESRMVTRWIRDRSAYPVIISGDFNQPTDSAIYRQHWRGWSNAFEAEGLGFGYTEARDGGGSGSITSSSGRSGRPCRRASVRTWLGPPAGDCGPRTARGPLKPESTATDTSGA